MSRHPASLRTVTALLEAGTDEPLRFRAGAEPALAAALAAVPTDRAAGVPEVRALLGLVVVLREEQRSPTAAALLDAALARAPEVVHSLIAIEEARVANVEATKKRLGDAAPKRAPQLDVAPPAGAVKVSSLGNAGVDLDRLRARR